MDYYSFYIREKFMRNCKLLEWLQGEDITAA